MGYLLPKCGGRTIKGYANLMWFSEQVRNPFYNVTWYGYVHVDLLCGYLL